MLLVLRVALFRYVKEGVRTVSVLSANRTRMSLQPCGHTPFSDPRPCYDRRHAICEESIIAKIRFAGIVKRAAEHMQDETKDAINKEQTACLERSAMS